MSPNPSSSTALILLLLLGAGPLSLAEELGSSSQATPERLILAHYMPWYTAKPHSDHWGWHWTMNHFDPEQATGGRREIASRFYPLIGPYDSGDRHVLEYHLLLMKLSGIDGVIVDWYGLSDYRDYGTLHSNTVRLVEQVNRFGMKFVICYEDQTIPALVEAQRLAAGQQVAHAAGEIKWLAQNWFGLDSYVRIDGKPVLLSFGYSGLSDEQWTQCLQRAESPIAYFSEHRRRKSAVGAYDWPIPQRGLEQIATFKKLSRDWPRAIPVAFPRFDDIYAEANVGKGYKRITDDGGRTFQTTISQACQSRGRLIQIATWNDWGEGTQIEPSREFRYRDLEFLQQVRRKHVDAAFEPRAEDLRIPSQLLQLRRTGNGEPNWTDQLDRIAQLVTQAKFSEARLRLKQLEQR